jgi:hypothetical protein
MKVKVFKYSIYEIEDIINEWFKNNVNISIINIKSQLEEHHPWHMIVMIYYEDVMIFYDDIKSKDTCYYESDDTTAMNCKFCGRPKYVHNLKN